MKKLGLLLIPLVAASFLINCGNNNPKPEIIIELPTRTVMSDGHYRYETLFTYNNHGYPIKIEQYNYDLSGTLTMHVVTEQTYNEHDDPTTFLYKENDETLSSYTSTYDYQDKCTIRYEKSTLDTNPFNNKYIFKYDDLNRLTLEEYYHANTLEGEPTLNYKYEYTYINNYQDYKKMKHTEYEDIEEIDTTIQNFDDKGRVITHTEYKGDHNEDDFTRQELYTYDDYNCVTELTTILPNVTPYKTVTTSTYYKNNPLKPLKSHRKGYDKDEEIHIESDETYEYDNKDRMITDTYNDTDNNHRKTEYYYD